VRARRRQGRLAALRRRRAVGPGGGHCNSRLGQLSDASGDLAQRLLSTPSSPTLPGAAATGGIGLRAAAGGSGGGALV